MNFSAKMRKPGELFANLPGIITANKTFIRQLMRISVLVTLILLTTFQLLLATAGKGQDITTEKVTLGLKQQSVETAIKAMERQTSFVYYYRKADLKKLTNITLPYGTRTVEQTLQELLKNTFVSYRQVNQNIFIEKQTKQTAYEIKGRVINIARKPVDYANVSIQKADFGKVLQSVVTDTGGYFKLNLTEKGNYLLKISAVGMDSISVAVSLADLKTIQLPDIVLGTKTTNLKEVTIVSKKPLIEQKIDRTVVNVDALISNAGTTALEVLEKSPGVQVDEQNGSISLKGKAGVAIYIDDKPTYLSGDDLQNYLRSLPSSTLDQVEIMTNPPAKYDAAGNSGVINIRTKRNKAKGFNGGFSLAYVQGVKAKTNNSFNFNYRDNKFNFFGTASYNVQNGFNYLDINRRYENADGSTSSYFMQHNDITNNGQAVNTKIGMDYYQSDKTTWGIVLNGMYRPSTNNFLNTSKLLNAGSQLDSLILAHNRESDHFKNGGINLNYRHEYDKNGKELTADLDYIVYRNNRNQQFNNESYLPDQTLISKDLLTGTLPSDIHIYSAKTDYTHPLAGGFKLAAGVKSSYTQTDNLAVYSNTVNNVTTPDYDKSNHFIYKENINAAYLNLNKDFKNLSIQAGLRVENTGSDGHQLGNAIRPDSAFKRNYTDLFPTFYLLYKLDTAGNNQLGLKYGRRINRPYYQDLNPFITPLDKFTYYVGNPLLNPAFTNNIELSHTFKNRITTTISYGKTTNDVDETIQILNGIYYSRPGNIGSTISKTISIDASFDPASWFNFHIYAEVGNNEYKSNFYTGPLDTKGTYVYIQPILQFSISKTWNAQLDGYYQSKITYAQFVLGNREQVNGGVSKKLSASTTLKLTVNDIFYIYRNTGVINNLALAEASYHNRNDTRLAVLTLSYRFGKAIANQRQHEANGAESEKNRVKN
ncbi:MAG: Outer rane receptor protein mostly Fe transport [Mucilaginibacter sp.]|nr:Outer rane receptor protein mostly Fe transport [Mucilaginibacter sp.]